MFGETLCSKAQRERNEDFEVVVDDEVHEKFAELVLVQIFTPIGEPTEIARNRFVGDVSENVTVRESEYLLAGPISAVDRNAGRYLACTVKDVLAAWTVGVLPELEDLGDGQIVVRFAFTHVD